MIPYTYRAEHVATIDGDTFDARLDLGYHLSTLQRFRLLGYEAPELRGLESPMGREARDALNALLWASRDKLEITSHKDDSFGRWLAEVVIDIPASEPARLRGAAYRGRLELVPLLISLGYGLPRSSKDARPTFDPARPYPLRSGLR